MVHKLRTRNICESSPRDQVQLTLSETLQNGRKLRQRQKRKQPVPFIEVDTVTPPTTFAADTLPQRSIFDTPEPPNSTAKFVFGIRMQFNDLPVEVQQPFLHSTLIAHNLCVPPALLAEQSLALTEVNEISRLHPAATSSPDGTERHNNQSSYQRFKERLFDCVDVIIHERTFKKRHGVSLHAVQKALCEDYGYKYSRSRKIVTQYIRESIESGKLVQKTGRGASGSFLLNRKLHSTFKPLQKRNQNTLGKVKFATIVKRLRAEASRRMTKQTMLRTGHDGPRDY